MGKIDDWSPIRIPGKIRQYTSEHEDSGDPLNSWDASDWDNPDSAGLKDRLTPNHAGQWLLLAAITMMAFGVVMFVSKFLPAAHGSPWTLVGTLWPASLLAVYVHGRERGFSAASDLDWTFYTSGRTTRVLAGKFKERFGTGDVKHIKFTPLKSRSYGAFRFKFLKLGDLEADREDLISKAKGSNRGPDSDAHLLLPGTLTGENSNTVLGRVFGVHGGSIQFYDGGTETDMRVTSPSTLDDDIAAQVLNQLEMFETRIIPGFKSEIKTLETLLERAKQRAQAQRDPELDRLFGALDRLSQMVNGRQTTQSSDEDSDSEAEEITERAKEQIQS